MKYTSLLSLAAVLSIGAAALHADVTVGGAPMTAAKNIVENAVN